MKMCHIVAYSYHGDYDDYDNNNNNIATRYRLEGPGIESRWRRNFTHLSRPALRPTHPPTQWVPGHSQG